MDFPAETAARNIRASSLRLAGVIRVLRRLLGRLRTRVTTEVEGLLDDGRIIAPA